MAYFNFENRKVFYKIKGKGKPLFLLHGNTVSSKMFDTVIKLYTKKYLVLLIDFPGHGKSERISQFQTDFWFYNARVCYALLNHLKITNISVIGTSGGALVGLNLALEHPELVNLLIADSFEGEYPLSSYISTIKMDRERDKKKFIAQLIWFYMHGFGWKKIVDSDTKVNLDFYESGKSFFHKSISDLEIPTYLTGSLMDEYCSSLDKIYAELADKNSHINVHLFKWGKHPAMITNKNNFFNLVQKLI